MTLKAAITVVTSCAFLLTSVRPARASGEPPVPPSAAAAHAVSADQLHQVLVQYQKRASTARVAVKRFFERTDVMGQIRTLGLSPDRLAQGAERLSDEDIVRLHEQIMTADQQAAPAGMGTAAIIVIVVVGVLVVLGIVAAISMHNGLGVSLGM